MNKRIQRKRAKRNFFVHRDAMVRYAAAAVAYTVGMGQYPQTRPWAEPKSMEYRAKATEQAALMLHAQRTWRRR